MESKLSSQIKQTLEFIVGTDDDLKSKNLAKEYAIQNIKTDTPFLHLRKKSLDNLYKLPGNQLKIMLYLLGDINRDTGISKAGEIRKVWMNLNQYFNSGYLVTARTQKYIAKRIKADEGEVSRGLKQLESKGYLKVLGKLTKPGTYINYTVFGLGVREQVYQEIVSVYYFETVEEPQEEDEDEF